MSTERTPPAPGTPDWWLVRLLARLQDRQADLQTWDRYYEGDQPMAFASQRFREVFGARFPAFTSNFCSLVVDGTAERMEVQGFRFTDPVGDQDVWNIWQDNDLDAGSQQAHTELLVKGSSYVLVEPPGSAAGDGKHATITIEDACDTIVEADPRDRRRRLAGLKRWLGDDGRLVVYLYLPTEVHRYRSRELWRTEWDTWWGAGWPQDARGVLRDAVARGGELLRAAQFEPLPGAENSVLRNTLGVVPLVELPNRPRLKHPASSEVKAIRSNQDAINKYRVDALIASEFGSFPQRYLLNYEPERDPDTGAIKAPFKAGIEQLWTIPPADPEDPNPQPVTVGQFEAASLEPYARMIELEVSHLSGISRMPFHMLLGQANSVPPSAEQTKSSESGLVRKVGRIEVFVGEGWEEVMRVALLAEGDPRGSVRTGETIWRDSETRNEAVRTDAVVKLLVQGVIDHDLAREMIGLTPEQLRRLHERLQAAQGEPVAATPPSPPPMGTAAVVPAPTGPRMGPNGQTTSGTT